MLGFGVVLHISRASEVKLPQLIRDEVITACHEHADFLRLVGHT